MAGDKRLASLETPRCLCPSRHERRARAPFRPTWYTGSTPAGSGSALTGSVAEGNLVALPLAATGVARPNREGDSNDNKHWHHEHAAANQTHDHEFHGAQTKHLRAMSSLVTSDELVAARPARQSRRRTTIGKPSMGESSACRNRERCRNYRIRVSGMSSGSEQRIPSTFTLPPA